MVTRLFKKRVKQRGIQTKMTLVQVSGSRRTAVLKRGRRSQEFEFFFISGHFCRLKSTDDSLLFITIKAGPYHAQ